MQLAATMDDSTNWPEKIIYSLVKMTALLGGDAVAMPPASKSGRGSLSGSSFPRKLRGAELAGTEADRDRTIRLAAGTRSDDECFIVGLLMLLPVSGGCRFAFVESYVYMTLPEWFLK
jgi:hypothetical protein